MAPYRMLWLPDALQSAGLKVATDPGWESRGNAYERAPLGVMCHFTGVSDAGNMPTLRSLREGRRAEPGLDAIPGPLAQLGLGRDGTFYVVASGRANHAGTGSWNGIATGNTSFIGIEAENSGRASEGWPQVQMDAYQRGVAALLAQLGRTAASCCGHKEYALPAGRKTDPNFDMNVFRKAVTNILSGTAPQPTLIPAAEPAGKMRPTLRRGDSGDEVKVLQAKLKLTPAEDGFGPRTEAAARQFQRDNNLVPDGIVGPKSWAILEPAPA